MKLNLNNKLTLALTFLALASCSVKKADMQEPVNEITQSSLDEEIMQLPAASVPGKGSFSVPTAEAVVARIQNGLEKSAPATAGNFARALTHSAWVITEGQAIDAEGKIRRPTSPRYTEGIIKGKNTIGMPSVVGIKKNGIKFDTNLKTLLDCEFYWQLFNY